ncbi:DUF11 domain-containing protein [Streptomyces sp. FH025]|uniref:DUF7927 domain-containing protein n=1 Tax=Streptomyces sp. FH025 TaxID=2815937 RepID=UPI001A9F3897|nr:DUF11 domain-containing protein [Streptomyces sp. FH025]MBO1418050.1 DUF11 domain-containing protein [Streptomyces sp. FH025]
MSLISGPGARRGMSLSLVLALLLTMLSLAAQAWAATVYQIEGRWAPNTPTKVASGDVVTAEWRVNVNDDAQAPANGPVDNVTVSVALTNGVFDSLPGLCLTKGVTPASALSADKKTLTCNLGTQQQGTAVALQAPVVADGPTGSQLTAVGAIDGHSAALPPLDIANPFAMDMRWGVGAANFSQGAGYFELDYEWTLSKGRGSDPGPQTITYDLTIASQQGSAVQLAPQGCTPYSIPAPANGHPWSGGGHPADRTAPFVDSCQITQTGPNTFQLTISGIDYNPANPPTLDSAGGRLPSDQVALASGSIWVRVLTTAEGSAELKASAPTYTSTTGQTAQDNPANNTESKSWTTPGTYSSGWGRGYTGSGGTTWDDTYRVSAGTTVGQYMDTAMQLHTDRPDDRLVGLCSALDTKYVTFNGFRWTNPAGGVNGAVVEYYTGNDAHLDPTSAAYDPNGFNCGVTGGWSTTPPADQTQVKAVRVTATQGQMKAVGATNINQNVFQTIKPDVPAGTDVWSFFSGIMDDPLNNWWNKAGCILNTPGLRYPCTTGFRDVVRVTTASPAIGKSVDRAVVTPGVPATYTLNYSANGAGAIPATVDGFKIVDTLPAGVTYVPGSASPEPAVTTDGPGRQVLTWTLDGVTTNVDHALTYQAVADTSATPGQALTNSATASYGGITTAPATAQVTVATNGYTTIAKTADASYIPNVKGDGKGSGSWTVTLRSYDPVAQAFTDTIDVLPYKGDGRGTSYSGSYTLASVTPVAGATVYYTTAAPGTLSDDPADPMNGKAGDVTGNSVGWTTTFTPNATAVRVIGPSLAPGARQQFKVAVATDGAVGGDTLVNRAQGRDGHTELVMRTSAPITVANYYSASLKKFAQGKDGQWHDANEAADYPVFQYGDTVKYRIVVTNTGQGTLTNVKVADDKFPQAGAFTIASLAPGASESHEFSTVLDTSVSGTFVNTASATADTPPDSGVPPVIPPDPAGIEVTNYTVTKTADPASGQTVAPGDKVTYTVKVKQQGSAPAQATLSDDLSKVLDDADYNGDVKASTGTAQVKNGVLTWNGTVPVGGEATITYSVTVKAGGDGDLANAVLSPGCAAAADGSTPGCTTHHETGWYTFSKVADPKSGSTVQVGDKVTYTVTVSQKGAGDVKGATVTDDLSKVLDDAAYNGDVKASSGAAVVKDGKLIWSGDLPVGGTATITYSVTVNGNGDGQLHNAVTTPDDKRGHCETEKGCETDHLYGSYTFSKVADPKSGSTVQVGDKVTYTVTVTQHGKAGMKGATVTDDLSKVLDDAAYNGDVKASTGSVSVTGDKLAWTGDLPVGGTATITYSVTVNGNGDAQLHNVVTTPDDKRGHCDTEEGCETDHMLPGTTPPPTEPPAPGSPEPGNPEPGPQAPAPSGILAHTGAVVLTAAGIGGTLLILGGLALALSRRRRNS